MAGRDQRRCRTSRRVSRPASSTSIRAPPSAKAPVRSRVPKRAVARKPSGLDGILKETKYRGILHRPAPQKFDSVAARRAPCRVFPARVASLSQWTGKTAVRGFVGERAGGREPRFWGRWGGSILVQDKAVASPRVTPSRNAGREVTDSGRFAAFGQRFREYRVTSLFGVRCHL